MSFLMRSKIVPINNENVILLEVKPADREEKHGTTCDRKMLTAVLSVNSTVQYCIITGMNYQIMITVTALTDEYMICCPIYP